MNHSVKLSNCRFELNLHYQLVKKTQSVPVARLFWSGRNLGFTKTAPRTSTPREICSRATWKIFRKINHVCFFVFFLFVWGFFSKQVKKNRHDLHCVCKYFFKLQWLIFASHLKIKQCHFVFYLSLSLLK